MTSKTLKVKINEFLCKHAQPDYRDKYGNIIRKPDGKAYKTGKVTGLDVLCNLIIFPFMILGLISVLVSLIGDTVGKKFLLDYGININVYWLIDPLIRGMIFVCVFILLAAILYAIVYMIHKLLAKEVATCPIAEVPPKRNKCEACGAPLPFENEEIKVRVRFETSDRRSLGDCDICKAPKLYEKEEYTVEIRSYNKPKPK